MNHGILPGFAGPGSPTALAGTITVAGPVRSSIVTVPATVLDCALSNVFVKTVNANTALLFANVPTSGLYFSAELLLTLLAGTITHPPGTIWSNNTAPQLTANARHRVVYETINGGTTWFASVGANYPI